VSKTSMSKKNNLTISTVKKLRLKTSKWNSRLF